MSKRSDGWRGSIRFEKEIDMANQKELKKGVKVRFIDESMHLSNRMLYPVVGTVGVIDNVCDDDGAWVDWKDDGVKCHGIWHSPSSALEIIKSRPPKILITVDKADPQKVIAKDLGSGKTGVAKCNPTDTFDFYTGAKMAFARLCGEDKPKEPQKRKFKVGDKVVGNKKASANYSITREGWRGTVFEVPPDEDFIWVRSENGDSHFYVRTSSFDLLTEPKGWNGKVVCVEPHSMYFTAGKVYTVKNGVMLKDNGSPANTTLIKGPDDLRNTHILTSKFIECKGEA